MPTDIRTKDDIAFHQLGNGYARVPAVNVKVDYYLPRAYQDFRKYEPDANPHFTEEWLERHISDDHWYGLFGLICEWGWERIQEAAQDIWGRHVKVYSEGRQGGWAYVEGINTDVESWDAIDLAHWRRFASAARAEADDVPYQMVSSVYINEFEEWKNQ